MPNKNWRIEMGDDDMSFMEDVFLNRQLPFAEYLVECGYHPITLGDKVSGALHDMNRKYGMHFSAKYKIPCKGGAVFEVSVISGKMFYSRADAPYEVMGPDMDDDVLGNQTDEDLMVYLAKLIARAKEY
jgi:hypothetical protein